MRRRGLPTRYARRIRRGIRAARIVHDLQETRAHDKAAQVFGVVHQFGKLTRRALYREYARLVIQSDT